MTWYFDCIENNKDIIIIFSNSIVTFSFIIIYVFFIRIIVPILVSVLNNENISFSF